MFDATNTTANAAKEGSKLAPTAAGAIAAPPSTMVKLKPTVAAAHRSSPHAGWPFWPRRPAPKADDPAKPEETAKAKPPKTDPVSVFISRKTGKLYVRHGWEPLFEIPVTIRNPELVWGTHVFTAMEFKEDQSTLRWVSLSLAPDCAAHGAEQGRQKERQAIGAA